MAQIAQYGKVPVGQRAVSPAIEDSEEAPGGCRNQQGDEIGQPRPFPDPSEQVENDQKGMEYGEENIQKPHPELICM